jgi:hypothetical protein
VVARLSSSSIALGWLVRLRWHAAGGPGADRGRGHLGLGLALPVVPLLALVAMTSVSNLLLALWLHRAPTVRPGLVGGVLALDTLLLTGLLALAGGPAKREDGVLGFEAVALAHEDARGLTLAELVREGRLTHAPEAPPRIPGTPVERAALGYLHMNCGVSCHMPPLGTRVVDEQGRALVQRWIESLPARGDR